MHLKLLGIRLTERQQPQVNYEGCHLTVDIKTQPESISALAPAAPKGQDPVMPDEPRGTGVFPKRRKDALIVLFSDPIRNPGVGQIEERSQPEIDVHHDRIALRLPRCPFSYRLIGEPHRQRGDIGA